MNTLINHLIDDVNVESAFLKNATQQFIHHQISRADQLKSKVHHQLSKPKVATWTFILTVLIANFLVEV